MKSIKTVILNYFFWGYFALITLFGIGVYSLTAGFYQEVFKRDHRNTLERISKNFESHLKGQLQSLDTLAKLISGPKVSIEEGRLLTRRFLPFSTLIGTIHVYKKNGDLVIAEKKGEIPKYNKEKNLKERKYSFVSIAEQVIHQRATVFSPVYLTRDKWPFFLYLVPIFEGSEVWGFVSGAIAPKSKDFSYMIEGLSMAQDNKLVLSDERGDSLIETGTLSDHYEVLEKKLNIAGLRFSLFVSNKALRDREKTLLKYLTAAYVIGVLFSLLIAAILSPRLSRPLQKVSGTLKKLNSGDFTARCNLKGKDEITHLGRLTDNLGEKIEKDKYLATLWSSELNE